MNGATGGNGSPVDYDGSNDAPDDGLVVDGGP